MSSIRDGSSADGGGGSGSGGTTGIASTTSGCGICCFSYGSLTNPVQRAKRGIKTVWARAAVLRDYELSFGIGKGASATVFRSPNSKCVVYGVVMEFETTRDWEIAKEKEIGYSVAQETVYPYNYDHDDPATATTATAAGEETISDDKKKNDKNNNTETALLPEPVIANVFHFDVDPVEADRTRLPQERYIRVIQQGMEHYGIRPDHIRDQILSRGFEPSPKPSEYRTFPRKAAPPLSADEGSCLPSVSMEEYQERSETVVPCFRIGNKVIELDDTKTKEELLEQHPMLKYMVFGQEEDFTWRLTQDLYDPSLPPCDRKEDIRDAHVRRAEDQMVRFLENYGPIRATHAMNLIIPSTPPPSSSS